MCFGFRISSPFHLDTLNIHIQNIKSPKNAKNACADVQFSPKFLQTIESTFSNIYFSAGNTWVEQKAARTTKFSQPNLFLSNTMLVLNKASLLLNVLSIVWRNLGENCTSAHAFLAFLGLLIFWMGMFKVSRWNGLEILNPKHMWKSQIQLLEQK